jgi:hypothetical protein
MQERDSRDVGEDERYLRGEIAGCKEYLKKEENVCDCTV